MTQIRSFRNVDLPVLLERWVQHFSTFGPPPEVDTARFEQAILARTFFDPQHLLLAEVDGQVEAWVHFASLPDTPNTAVIMVLCQSPTCDRSTAGELLDAAQQRIAGGGSTQVLFGPVRDNQLGYAGLDPIGHGLGVSAYDARTTGILQEHGFLPRASLCRMLVSTAGYRPAVNREALQLRRTTRLETRRGALADVRQSAAMSHLDIEEVRLVSAKSAALKDSGPLAGVGLWLSDAEAEVMRPSLAILDLAVAHQRGELESAESYLITSLIQSLAERRIESVETVIDEDKIALARQLESIGFQTVERGVCWEKAITS